MRPLVSVITPTFNRERFLHLVYDVFRRQSYPEIEWLVSDDSPTPSPFMRGLNDDRVRYFFDTTKRNNGIKRNSLIEAAQGEYIVQFDDDDYYAPLYVQTVVERLEAGADFVSLGGFFIYSVPHGLFGYWDTYRTVGIVQRWGPDKVTVHHVTEKEAPALKRNQLGYGFSYAFRKSVYPMSRFADDAWGAELQFIRGAIQNGARFKSYQDETGLVLHILRRDNASVCLPNYVLPPFMIQDLFPGMAEAWLTL